MAVEGLSCPILTENFLQSFLGDTHAGTKHEFHFVLCPWFSYPKYTANDVKNWHSSQIVWDCIWPLAVLGAVFENLVILLRAESPNIWKVILLFFFFFLFQGTKRCPRIYDFKWHSDDKYYHLIFSFTSFWGLVSFIKKCISQIMYVDNLFIPVDCIFGILHSYRQVSTY